MLAYLTLLECDEDKKKFEALYLKYRQSMFYMANCILRDEALAEDAVHQSFLKLVNRLDMVGEVKSKRTKAYLITIARNCAVDIYRKRKKQAGLPLEELTFEIESAGKTTEEECETLDNRVIAAILRLPEHYAAILRLKYGHDLPDREIARLLCLTEENVRKRTQRAKKKLGEILEGMGVKVYG